MALAVDLDTDTRAAVIDALRTAADQRSRAATRAAGELAGEKARGEIADERPGAVKIARWLADASRLVQAADNIEHAEPAYTAADASRLIDAALREAGARPAWAPVETIAELILATFPNVGGLAAQGIAWAVHGGAFDAATPESSPPVAVAAAPVEEPAAPAPIVVSAPRAAPKPADANGKVPLAAAADTTHAVLQELGMTFTNEDRLLDLDDLEELDEFDDGQTPEDRAGLDGVDAASTWATITAPTPTE